MRILVTGAAGLIGSHLCDALLHRDHSLRNQTQCVLQHSFVGHSTNAGLDGAICGTKRSFDRGW